MQLTLFILALAAWSAGSTAALLAWVMPRHRRVLYEITLWMAVVWVGLLGWLKVLDWSA